MVNIIIPILQKTKPKYSMIRQLAQGHTASKEQNVNSNPSILATQSESLATSCALLKVIMLQGTNKRTLKVQCLLMPGHIIIITFVLCNTEMVLLRGCLLSKKGWSSPRTSDHWLNYEWLLTPFFRPKAPLPPFLLSWILFFHGTGICNFSNLKEIKFGMRLSSLHWSVAGKLSTVGSLWVMTCKEIRVKAWHLRRPSIKG